MGAITFSLDQRLVKALTSALPADAFVETGTFKGDTLASVQSYFLELYSIELSREYFEKTRLRFPGDSRIRLIHDDSGVALRNVAAQLRGRPTIFFLDAHWCEAIHTAGTGSQSQCPLIRELRGIDKLEPESVVIVDDARLFLCTPPVPHEVSHWPEFSEVLNALTRLSDEHELMVVNDYIVFYPRRIREALKVYAREYGVDWLGIMKSIEQKDEKIELLRQACAARPSDVELKQTALDKMNDTLRAKDEEIELLRQVCAVRSRDIEAKQAALTKTNDMLRAKDEEIEWMQYRSTSTVKKIDRFFGSAGTRFVRSLAYPKLGKLKHHPPIPLRAPAPYVCTSDPKVLPVISLVTPSWKQARFIERTIESVLDQEYPRLEYFVQDGASDDGTVEIVERYANRLAGFEAQPDKGQAHAINRAFSRTKGEIMCWLNSDDIYLPGALAYVGEYFARHPEVDVVYGNRVLIDEEDMEIGRWIMPPHDDRVLSWADFVPQETLFWRRRVWEEAGGLLDESFRFALDWDLLLRFRSVDARMIRLPRFLGAFRVHASQKTSASIVDEGWSEMDQLRRRWTGLDDIGYKQIRSGIAPYLARHVAHDFVWRVRQRLATLTTREGEP